MLLLARQYQPAVYYIQLPMLGHTTGCVRKNGM